MIIGLCGYKGTGKSTVAEYLEKQHGFKRVNFKDGLVAELTNRFPLLLKEIIENENDKIDENIWSVPLLFKLKPPLMRALMQEYGTEVRRADDENYWVKQWQDKIRDFPKGVNIVTDDVRFFNELSALTEAGGTLVRIVRPDITSGGTHASELEHEKFVEDFTLNGVPGILDEVYKQVDELLKTIK